MKKYFTLLVVVPLMLAGCNRGNDAAGTAESSASPSTEQASQETAVEQPKLTRAQRRQQILKSGKVGVWADDMPEICAAQKKAVRITLTWNVENTGVEHVIVDLVDSGGHTRKFATGGAVGEKATGAWVRPGMAFKVKAADSGDELASLVIPAKQC